MPSSAGSARGDNDNDNDNHSNNGSNSPRRSKSGRANKIYRAPPTPPPEVLRTKEKSFILDCRATSSISGDYSRANPKLGPVIPPYNSQRDSHVDPYFRFHGVQRTLKRTGQNEGGHSIEGPVMDAFYTRGAGFQYLSLRNQFGAGHSRDQVDGHAQFMEGIRPVTSYNGRYGFRRNSPWLRKHPSPFFPNIITPTF
ncbi:sperm microtubule associated protein 1-like [Babylonia areolata]|uniref:sperm microtubule associated protein 1-like n=1 Tax=Babylonia areolata TaxID=304850 RepID=UPI003FD18257